MPTETATPRPYSSVHEGDTFQFEKPPITTVQLAMYAGASGDFNRIHYDHHFAMEAGLGGVIAHGMLSMGCLAEAVTAWAGAGALVKDVRSRFLTPVKPGDTLRFEGRVAGTTDGAKTCAVEVEGFVADRKVIAGSAVVALPDA